MLRVNKSIQKLLPGLLLVVGLGACKKDFLEINPKGKLIAEKTADYNLLLNGNSLSTTSLFPQFVLGDEVAAATPYFAGANSILSDEKAFRWEDDLYLPSDNNSELTTLMRSVYVYNKIINEVMDSQEGEEAQKQSIMAEALGGRAWCYFMLINYYGKPYNAATAATDLGVPKVTAADVTQTKFTRATVKEIYDFIIDDLTRALPYLPAQLTNRTRMSKAAGEALLGKVYVFMGQFDKALTHLDAAVNDLSGASIPVGLYDFQKELSAGGAFTPVSPFLGPARSNLYNDQEALYLRQSFNYYSQYLSGVVINSATASLYTAGDFRLQFLSSYPLLVFTETYPKGMLRGYGRGFTNLGASVPDIYLLRAECKARLNNVAGAVTDMEAFRQKRMPAAEAVIPAAVAANQIALTKFILEERIREFALEGYRWFDMRRLSVDPVYKSTVGSTHIVYNMSGVLQNTYTLKSERLTLRFPLYIINSNPGMEQNP
ncbi:MULTISPECIES: RagB/SusD family nutrient uptake outer membrane protein [unclassified Chitinophaga]|uniref:RagB/SusD family nutrient uptake outer membrane protein n=1 Tax=unclassified Chitinophaga TaxID=2619133 RepID=UPI0030103ACC